jgi:hypothetical protein
VWFFDLTAFSMMFFVGYIGATPTITASGGIKDVVVWTLAGLPVTVPAAIPKSRRVKPSVNV